MMSRQTYCRVEIVTPAFSGRDSETLVFDGAQGPLSGLMSVSVQTGMKFAANSFSLVFSPSNFEREPMSDRIPQNSLCTIRMGSSADRGSDDTVIIGLTSGPIETEVFTAAGPQRMVTIPGRGLESILAEVGIYYSKYLGNRSPAEIEAIDPELAPLTVPANAASRSSTMLSWSPHSYPAGIDPREALTRIWARYVVDVAGSVVNLRLGPDTKKLGMMLVAGNLTGSDPSIVEWAKNFATKIREAQASGTNVAEASDKALKDKCPIPSKWKTILPGIHIPTKTANPSSGSVLDIMECVTDPVFHEFFVRYTGKTAEIVFRPRPFRLPEQSTVGTQFNVDAILDGDLDDVNITTGDMRGQNQLRTGLPIHNLWQVVPAAGQIQGSDNIKAMASPRWSGGLYYSDFMRFGLRPFETTWPYDPADMYLTHSGATVAAAAEDQKKGLVATSERLSHILQAWEDPHPVMESGTLTVAGRAEFRPGTRLIWRGEDVNGRPDGRPLREFYLEGVSHSYEFASGGYNCQLRVTRGWAMEKDGI